MFRKKILKNKKAMALVTVLILSACIAVYVYQYFRVNVQEAQATKTTSQNTIVMFLAQSAMQHALLKFKLLPNELYDAVSISKVHDEEGKKYVENPFFDFAKRAKLLTEQKDSDGNADGIFLTPGRYYNPGPIFIDLPAEGLAKKDDFLTKFKDDIKEEGITYKDAKGTDILKDGAYGIEEIKVVSMKGQQRYERDVLKIKAFGRGKVLVNANYKEITETLEKIVEVKRRN